MKKYVKKVWLNRPESASTGSVVVFDGPYKYKDDMNEIRDSFVEVKDCQQGIRLHRTYEDSEQDFIDKVEILRNVLTDFIKHLKSMTKQVERTFAAEKWQKNKENSITKSEYKKKILRLFQSKNTTEDQWEEMADAIAIVEDKWIANKQRQYQKGEYCKSIDWAGQLAAEKWQKIVKENKI